MKKKKYKSREQQGWIYITPWIIGFFVLQLYPFIQSLYYSFCNYQLGGTPEFIGLANYIKLFTQDKDFTKALDATFQYAFLTVPFKLLLALIIALILNQKLKGINFIRTIYYIPSLFGGSVAVCALWKLMFNETGIINRMLNTIGLNSVSWLGNPNVAMKTIAMMEVWQFGSSMILFLAALKNVPRDLYEAASIDGAGKLKQFFKITVPQISSIILFNLLMQSITAIQNFTSSMVVTNGGPNKSTYVLGMKLYYDGFSYFKMGYASATSWVMFTMILIITLLILVSSKKWVYYEDENQF